MTNKKNKIKIGLIVATLIIALILIAVVGFISYISPPKDDVDVLIYPPEFFCKTEENRIDYQTDGNCAAYASAYLLRNLGENSSGEELTSEIGRVFGFVPAYKIADLFKRRGYQVKTCHGNVETLKQQLTNGNPIIVFIRIPNDTHYAVVVGYDEQNIYLADSLSENANASDSRYNRILTTEQFKDVWKTGTILPDNIYVVVKKQTGNL